MTLLLVLWVVLGALVLLGLRPLLGGWGPAALVVWPAYILLGLALAAGGLKASMRPGIPPSLRSLRPLLIFTLGGGLLFAIHPWLARCGDARAFRARLARNRPMYDSLVARLPLDSVVGPWRWHSAVRYRVDSGPPLRVAVLQPGRAYDGDEVALYDPRGAISVAGSPRPATRAFGGLLERCRPVYVPWYRCILHRSPR
jgi:hypothetical protein